jgi:hypothetical protein
VGARSEGEQVRPREQEAVEQMRGAAEAVTRKLMREAERKVAREAQYAARKAHRGLKRQQAARETSHDQSIYHRRSAQSVRRRVQAALGPTGTCADQVRAGEGSPSAVSDVCSTASR